MRNLESLKEEEIIKRAQELYFDHNKKVDVIYADEYGRFSYNKQSLIEQNDSKVKIFEINRKGIQASKKQAPNKEAQN